MSSPEVENFEITDEDVYSSFNLRKGRRQTKNQATYGKKFTPTSCSHDYKQSILLLPGIYYYSLDVIRREQLSSLNVLIDHLEGTTNCCAPKENPPKYSDLY